MSISAIKSMPSHTRVSGVASVGSTSESAELLSLRQRETANYIADMILELRNMGKAAKLYQVLVPLEYAYYEAFAAAHRVEAPVEQLERLRELSKAAESYETPVEDY